MSKKTFEAFQEVVNAIVYDLTDSELEQLIGFLQSKVKHPKLEHLVVKYLKESPWGEGFESPEMCATYYWESKVHQYVEQELQETAGINIDWDYIFKELHKDDRTG